ncbi:murein transglycosylase [Jannaschia pagri]|uniref:peptidoglycan lytic exotransglycosylase n=1 Tax=Jannaschia pagri TaxID=2829797 RepID=A0ABQ4NLH9_9RHOB|nr:MULTISPECIES: MltA domain-containing protein [unclassified Jannaschia]GIT91439.1 murein transglycosylase [Jannaschia sp. AI_61]GIT95273.1 murein transglycosylase [Jannaschia sp. AI_62]
MAAPRATLAAPETGRLSFSDLPGWREDDLALARRVFERSSAPQSVQHARSVFETDFALGHPVSCHLTGYYEPEIEGSLHATDQFPVPLHGVPETPCTLTRAQIEGGFDGPVLAWVRDHVERFFLQVQGSGRLRLQDGTTLRLGFGAKTAHPYRSIGQVLRDRGEVPVDVTADQVKDWLRADPERGRAMMARNPSYVFFRVQNLPDTTGPIGTLGLPVTAGRSIAVDPDHIPLGTLVWLDAGGVTRLCIAQDTGSAIKGPGRVDLFMGTGAEAGHRAGALNATGRLIPLVRR